ncbi:hypothetical protein G6M89_08610 [Natronolimnobius sp. AArcel1]|uniref:antitoxin VapB family protein n=1 Tax=Natronolimnobius sp. AArcel1 TaxID=1679093 RepID=UPI0013ED15CA|nr:antitoxin VapB family protein [Natronolimnobius sp. AArcel1]NGM69069.1 hypothetical protein [Natronolimnobius sp. AArcel1]
MAMKTLRITEEAYERLQSHKRGDESVTDTILRLTEPDTDGFGVLADDDGFASAAGRTHEELDDAFDRRRKQRNSDT